MDGQSHTLRQWLLLRLIAAEAGDATIKRLVAEFGVSDKTIRRDVAELRQAGFPIVERVGDFGRKTFALEAADLPPLSFTYDEALALSLCQNAIAPLAGTFFWVSAEQAFRKIQATLGERVRAYVRRMLGRVVQLCASGNYAGKAELVDQLVIAIEESKAAFITYQSQRATEPVTADVYPYGLVEHRGSLYLIGFSLNHEEIRTWKIDRMLNAEKTKMPFQHPADFDLAHFLSGSFGVYHGRGDVLVRVRFAASAARYVSEKQMHASQTVTMQRDSSALVEFKLSNTTEVKSWILSFGAAAEVLEPTALRDEIRAEVDRMQAVYATNTERDSAPPAKAKSARRAAK